MRLRTISTGVAVIASSGNLSNAINMTDVSGAEIHMPGTWTAASIAFKTSISSGGTFLALYDADGSLVQVSAAASRAISLPAELFASHYVKLWSQNAGSNENQAGERTISVLMKA
jgi:hypothetical protein